MITYKGKKYFSKKEAAEKLGLTTRGLLGRQDRAKVDPLRGDMGRIRVNLYTAKDIRDMAKFADPRKKGK